MKKAIRSETMESSSGSIDLILLGNGQQLHRDEIFFRFLPSEFSHSYYFNHRPSNNYMYLSVFEKN